MKYQDDRGYILILSPHHPFKDSRGYVYEHRLVMEKALGRFIDPKIWAIHHINKIKYDNRPENLMCVTSQEHSKLDNGWERQGDVWKKICRGCNRQLEVNSTNFYFRKKNGKATYLCKTCHCAKRKKYQYAVTQISLCKGCGKEVKSVNFVHKKFCTRSCGLKYRWKNKKGGLRNVDYPMSML